MVEELKMKYNYILNRYYNGCNYIEANPIEFDRYIDKIMDFKSQLDKLLNEISKVSNISNEEVLGGFKI